MNNSIPTTDRNVLERITDCALNLCNGLKNSNMAYLKYLDMMKNDFNINELLIELVKWNPDSLRTEFFRDKKSKHISDMKKDCKEGRLPQNGDNLTIMDNPVALLMKAVGEEPLEEGCFELMQDGVQCYTPRFNEGNRLAAFRSPDNSPNNIIHLYNVYPDKLINVDIGRVKRELNKLETLSKNKEKSTLEFTPNFTPFSSEFM